MKFPCANKKCLFLSVLILFGSLAFNIQTVSAQNTADCIIDSRFGSTERGILKTACGYAVTRMQRPEVRARVKQRAKYGLLSSNIMELSHVTNTSKDRWNLLAHQLYWLSQPNGENDTELPFPNIHIQYASERANWLGRAQLDVVRVYWDSALKEWRQKGNFVITINDYYVARGQRFSDPNDWAGTVAHEMAHNLGHRHPDIDDPDYDNYQINILDAAVQNYGSNYKGTGNKTLLSSFRCE